MMPRAGVGTREEAWVGGRYGRRGEAFVVAAVWAARPALQLGLYRPALLVSATEQQEEQQRPGLAALSAQAAVPLYCLQCRNSLVLLQLLE